MTTGSNAIDESAPSIQAHRGFAGVAPENTILAARVAAERYGADWVEVDVQPTADGTVVCFHDAALGEAEGSRGITDATGIVRATPTEDVLAAEVLDSGATIPRLADLLDALPESVGVNVELKNPGGPADDDEGLLFDDNQEDQRELWDDLVADVAPILADRDRPIALSSFFEGALAAAREHVPDRPRAIIPAGDLQAGIAIAERQDAAWINAPAEALIEAGTPFVAEQHDAGRVVNAWTVEEWTTFRDLATIGVDGVIADYPFPDATL